MLERIAQTLREKSGELAFNTADYATEEEGTAALHAFIHDLFEQAEKRNATSEPTSPEPDDLGDPNRPTPVLTS